MRGKEKFKLSTKPSLLVPHEYSGSWKFKLCRLYGCKQHNSAHFGYVSGEGVAQKYSQIKEKGLDRQDPLLSCAYPLSMAFVLFFRIIYASKTSY